MYAQLLLNIAIAFLWMQFSDQWSTLNFLMGYLVGLGLLFLMRRFFTAAFYLKRLWAVLKLTGLFFKELLFSSVFVIRQVVSPKITFEGGIFALATRLRSDWEITVLALLITLTPGSVVFQVSPDNSTLYIHAMDIKQAKETVIRVAQGFEELILEVARDV